MAAFQISASYSSDFTCVGETAKYIYTYTNWTLWHCDRNATQRKDPKRGETSPNVKWNITITMTMKQKKKKKKMMMMMMNMTTCDDGTIGYLWLIVVSCELCSRQMQPTDRIQGTARSTRNKKRWFSLSLSRASSSSSSSVGVKEGDGVVMIIH